MEPYKNALETVANAENAVFGRTSGAFCTVQNAIILFMTVVDTKLYGSELEKFNS